MATASTPTPQVPPYFPIRADAYEPVIPSTKDRIKIHDLDLALDQFESEARKAFQDLSGEDHRAYNKAIDRYVIKLRREFFRMCNTGHQFDYIRETFKQSIAHYRGLLQQFQASCQANKAAQQRETNQNLDLKTTISNAFLQAIRFADCEGIIPPVIDYDRIPPATRQFSHSSPELQQPPKESYQDTHDLIDQAMCYWEGVAGHLLESERDSYLYNLNITETMLLGRMKLDEEQGKTPDLSLAQAKKTIEAAHKSLKENFRPSMPDIQFE